MVRRVLTWLHISDIHFRSRTEWRDSIARTSLLAYLKKEFDANDNLRPDLVFCTGDVAFGEEDASPLVDQYGQARAFFDNLLAVCGSEVGALPKDRLFIVPGNHDVNRTSVNKDAQANLLHLAENSSAHAAAINQRFAERPKEFKDAIKRLSEYSRFVESYLSHQYKDERLCYSELVNIDGLKVGVAGFNSAWCCSGPEDDRKIWLAAEWQFNTAFRTLEEADLRIGLIHHPVDWLNQAERDFARHHISTHFHFWCHGHIHDTWLTPTQSYVMMTAGAVGAETNEEFGISLVQIDLLTSQGKAYLHRYRAGDGDWTIAPVATHAPRGQWSFKLPSGIPELPGGTGGPRPSRPSYPPRLFNQVAPEPLFVGRDEVLRAISAWYTDPDINVVGLVGLGGEGKSTIVRSWYDSLKERKISPQGIFWWGFYRHPYLERFLDSLLAYLARGTVEIDKLKSTWAKADKINELIREAEYLDYPRWTRRDAGGPRLRAPDPSRTQRKYLKHSSFKR